jgi:hypothetical protein
VNRIVGKEFPPVLQAAFWLIILGGMIILGNEVMGKIQATAKKAVKKAG